jgi:AraC-like DNA-binding protein
MGETNNYLRETHKMGPEVHERIVSVDICPPLQQWGMGNVGLTEAGGLFRFVRVAPRIAQVLACLSGEGRVWTNGDWQPCREGGVYVTPPGVYHAYEAVSADPWRICWVHLLAQSDGQAPTTAGFDAPVLLEGDPGPLATAIEGLYREVMGVAAAPMLRLWTELILAQSQRLLETEGIDPRLRRLLLAFEARLDYPWTVAELARRSHLSEEHVRRLFRTHLGRSPMRHLTYLRMRHAAALLSSETYTVGAVAARVGYANEFAFSTAFKRSTGRSPSAYRRT